MKKFFITAALAAATLFVTGTANSVEFDSRIWLDTNGEHSIDGTLDPERSFAPDADAVYIVDSKGRTYSCALDQLSPNALEYLTLAKSAYNDDPGVKDYFEWILDRARNPGARRVVNVDGIEYAFRWIPPGNATIPESVFDPNLPRSVAAAQLESTRPRGAQMRVNNGFWMLETEVTLEMFNQFVTETGYKPGGAETLSMPDPEDSGASSVKSSDPYAAYDAAQAGKTAPRDTKTAEFSARIGYAATPPQQRGLKRGDEYTWKNPGFPQTKKHPVTLVTRNDAMSFCSWLSSKMVATKKRVSLPTTAQWYLASQPESGSLDFRSIFQLWAFGSSETWERGNLPDANYPVICPAHAYLMDRIHFVYRDSFRFTVPVGSFKPNRNGLYDMVGNVGEITIDDPNVVESLGGSWFHLPGFNPICWISSGAFGWDSPIERAINDYHESRIAPIFSEPVPQDPYGDGYGGYGDSYGSGYGDSYGSSYGDLSTMGAGSLQGNLGAQLQGNPFRNTTKAQPFIHVTILDVEATCFTGFRVVVQ